MEIRYAKHSKSGTQQLQGCAFCTQAFILTLAENGEITGQLWEEGGEFYCSENCADAAQQ
jgi:hypothetical protein